MQNCLAALTNQEHYNSSEQEEVKTSKFRSLASVCVCVCVCVCVVFLATWSHIWFQMCSVLCTHNHPNSPSLRLPHICRVFQLWNRMHRSSSTSPGRWSTSSCRRGCSCPSQTRSSSSTKYASLRFPLKQAQMFVCLQTWRFGVGVPVHEMSNKPD